MRPIIKTEKLSVIYFMGKSNQVNALTNASVEIMPGEFVVFFGPSGCGKSTFLYAIAGLEKNIQGNIYVDGKNLAKFSDPQIEEFRQHKIGMIFQAYYLIASLSVLKNVILPQFSLKLSKKEREMKALKLLDHFGVKMQANKYPNELSGGQQQRVAICRALINNPDVIFADEPTGNLDSKSAADVMGLLQELNRTQKKTIVLVTHSPANLGFAHRIFHMKDGKIISVEVNKDIKEVTGAESVESNKVGGDKEKGNKEKGKGEGDRDASGVQLSKDAELLARTFSNFSANQIGNMLIPFKAKELVAEVLSNMTLEEINSIEKEVEYLLMRGVKGEGKSLMNYLDKDRTKGGLSLNKITAKKISSGISDIVKEIKILEKEDQKVEKGLVPDSSEEVKQIRHYLFDVFNVKIENATSLKAINKAIDDRLTNKMDKFQVSKFLDKPIKKGGAGLDRRLARKLARRLELLILGKYK